MLGRITSKGVISQIWKKVEPALSVHLQEREDYFKNITRNKEMGAYQQV